MNDIFFKINMEEFKKSLDRLSYAIGTFFGPRPNRGARDSGLRLMGELLIKNPKARDEIKKNTEIFHIKKFNTKYEIITSFDFELRRNRDIYEISIRLGFTDSKPDEQETAMDYVLGKNVSSMKIYMNETMYVNRRYDEPICDSETLFVGLFEDEKVVESKADDCIDDIVNELIAMRSKKTSNTNTTLFKCCLSFNDCSNKIEPYFCKTILKFICSNCTKVASDDYIQKTGVCLNCIKQLRTRESS